MSVESRGAIEFHHADGHVVTGRFEDFAGGHLSRGDRVTFDGGSWVMYDRLDRGGITVFLCRLAEAPEPPSGARAITRGWR